MNAVTSCLKFLLILILQILSVISTNLENFVHYQISMDVNTNLMHGKVLLFAKYERRVTDCWFFHCFFVKWSKNYFPKTFLIFYKKGYTSDDGQIWFHVEVWWVIGYFYNQRRVQASLVKAQLCYSGWNLAF